MKSNEMTADFIPYQQYSGRGDFFMGRIGDLKNLSCTRRLNILGLETLNGRRVIFDLILCNKFLHGLAEINNCAISMQDINSTLILLLILWNSLPAAVVAIFKRNLAKLTFSSFYITLTNMFYMCLLYQFLSLKLRYFNLSLLCSYCSCYQVVFTINAYSVIVC